MRLLERSKVRLSITLDKEAFEPGEDVTGVVQLDVKEAISFCALRLRIKGKEVVEVFIQRGTATMAVTDEIDYAVYWMTFTGPCKRSQSREKQTYEPGRYTYPFRLLLSTNLPPSFAVTTNSGRVALQYTACAMLDIPNGFDATDETTFRVLSQVPLHQFRVRATASAAIPSTRIARVYRHDWGCCMWGKRSDAVVHVSASVTPGVLTLQQPLGIEASARVEPAATHATQRRSSGDDNSDVYSSVAGISSVGATASSGRPPVTCEATVKLFNDTSKTLPALKVEMVNVVRLQYDMHESFHTTVVAKAKLEHLNLAPQEERTVTLPLTLNVQDFRVTMDDAMRLPIPSLVTPVVTSTYALRVKLPKSKAEKDITFLGLVDVVDTVSSLAGVAGVPSHYSPMLGVGTEVRFVAQPTLITFPEEDQLVYPAVHEPYLPRAVGGDNNADSEEGPTSDAAAATHAHEEGSGGAPSCTVFDVSSPGVETRGAAEDSGPRRPLPSSPVLATPLPGHIIQGSVSQLADGPRRQRR